jgi:hypothetical protein
MKYLWLALGIFLSSPVSAAVVPTPIFIPSGADENKMLEIELCKQGNDTKHCLEQLKANWEQDDFWGAVILSVIFIVLAVFFALIIFGD